MFKNFFNKLFSLKGRYSKLEYLIYGILMPILIVIIINIIGAITDVRGLGAYALFALIIALVLYTLIVSTIKRVRAINGNIFFNLLMFILFMPFYIIYLFSVTTQKDSINRNIKQDFFDFVKFIIPILILMAIGYYNKNGANFKNPFASKYSLESKCEDRDMQEVVKKLIAQKLTQNKATDEYISLIDIQDSKKANYNSTTKTVECKAVANIEGIKTDIKYTIEDRGNTKKGKSLYINIDNESIINIYNNLTASNLQKPSCSSDNTLSLVKQQLIQDINKKQNLKDTVEASNLNLEQTINLLNATEIDYDKTSNVVKCSAIIHMPGNNIPIEYYAQIPPNEPTKLYVELATNN